MIGLHNEGEKNSLLRTIIERGMKRKVKRKVKRKTENDIIGLDDEGKLQQVE